MYCIIICFISMLSLSLGDFDINKISTNPLLKKFYNQFTQEIEIANEGKYINDIDDDVADLIRYNFDLTNEDKHLNVTQLVAKYGYPCEEYELQTPDGYIVTLIRIPGSGPPVLLMHGLVCSADDFVASGPGFSLAYFLADANYDIWMPNARGNKYSMKHISLSSTDARFWNFSFHEIGVYDLPTNIDFILEKVGQEKLYYIGHSQGTTSSYILLSEKPEYNEKLILLVSLSPVAFMNNVKCPLLRAFVPIMNEIYNLLNTIGVYDIFSDNVITDGVKETICGTTEMATTICSTFVMTLLGFDYVRLNFTNYPVQLAHVPAGSSNKQVVHYAQMVPPSAQFQQYDYGKSSNLVKYGSVRPPPYPIHKITVKTALFYSSGDWLSNTTDVHKLTSKLSNVVLLHEMPLPFAHMDYFWANDIKKILLNNLLQLLEKYTN